MQIILLSVLFGFNFAYADGNDEKARAEKFVSEQAHNLRKLCYATYDAHMQKNSGMKDFTAADRNLIVQSCVGRGFVKMNSCMMKLLREKGEGYIEIGKQEVSTQAAAADKLDAKLDTEVKKCMMDIGLSRAKDTSQISDLILQGKKTEALNLIDSWKKDGSLRFIKL